MSEERQVFIYTEKTTQRLDHFLTHCMPEYSRSRLQSIIKLGFVSVNNLPVTKTGIMLEDGDNIFVIIPDAEPSKLKPEEITLEIIFEDENVVVINKPAGMVVHPSAGHHSGTLVHAVLSHAPEMEGIGGEIRPGIVHRLDKDTSGVILVAKNDKTHQFLQDQFRNREVEKYYITLVEGHPPTPTGRIEAAIGRDNKERQRMAVVAENKGRTATSTYRTLKDFSRYTLIEVHPITGRTHQVRLHMAFIGCPVVGDIIYGNKHPSLPIKRHFLHAACLRVQLPGEQLPRIFEAALPGELLKILDSLQ
jgi:23S rRNA pseudouridine1911/1915/1917 synthase